MYKGNKLNKMSNSKSNDYLKYWRIIRYFIKNKYMLTTGELDMLLFLYSEEIFFKDKFNEYNHSWLEQQSFY